MDRKELKKLQLEWDVKLKESGFQDIEAPKRKNTGRLQFIKGHVRWDDYGTKDNFLRKAEDFSNFFRSIGLYAHYGPVPAKYKNVLILYSELGSLAKAVELLHYPVTYGSVDSFIKRNLPKILHFVNTMDEEDDTTDTRIN